MPVDVNQLFADALVAMLIAVCGYVTRYLHLHVGAQKVALASDAASLAVSAVEQMAKAGAIPATAKLYEAAARAKQIAATKGVRLPDDQWRSLLEQAVGVLNRFQPVIAIPPQPAPERAHG